MVKIWFRVRSVSKTLHIIGEQKGPVTGFRFGLLTIINVNGEAVFEAIHNKSFDARPIVCGVNEFNNNIEGGKFTSTFIVL